MTPPIATTRWRLRARDAVPTLLLLVVLLAGWQAWVSIRHTEPYILPAPSRIWQAFLQTRHLLPGHVATTVAESVVGLVVGAVIGAALAIVIASVPLVRRLLWPLLVASQTIPMIVLAPLLVLWFGFGMTPKVVVVALIVFFPVTVSTVTGLTGADREMVDLVRSMGGSRAQVMRTVLFPAAVPAFFAGLRISAAYAIAGAVIAEWVGASSGLGIFITRSQAAFRVDRVFVAVLIVAFLSMALFALVDGLARLASPWNYVRTDEEEHP